MKLSSKNSPSFSTSLKKAPMFCQYCHIHSCVFPIILVHHIGLWYVCVFCAPKRDRRLPLPQIPQPYFLHAITFGHRHHSENHLVTGLGSDISLSESMNGLRGHLHALAYISEAARTPYLTRMSSERTWEKISVLDSFCWRERHRGTNMESLH